MGLFETPTAPRNFAEVMIDKFGVSEGWYLEYDNETRISSNPTESPVITKIKVPIKIAITSWGIENIDNATILNEDRKGYIAFSDEIEKNVKAGNFIVNIQDYTEVMRYKIVTPTFAISFKDKISCFVANLRA